MKEEDKDLNYWKENAEECYMTTPIGVLRYITELEKVVKNNAVLPLVINAKRTVCRCFNSSCYGWNKNNTCKSDSFNCKGRQTDL